MTTEEKAKAYDEALRYAMIYYKEGNEDMKMMMKTCFPALVEESEDEKIRKAIIEYLRQRLDRSPSIPAAIGSWIAWLEKQGETVWSEETDDDAWLNDIISKVESGCTLNSSEIKWLKSIKDKINIHYWTEEEIEPIISDYLRGAEHYGGMIGRLRCLKPKSLEKQRTSYTKSDVDDAYLKGLSDAKNELEKQGEQKQYDIDVLEKHITKDSISELAHTVIVRNGWEIVDAKEQNPVWSEEDEEHYKACLQCFEVINPDMVYYKDYLWLISLKQRIGG